VPLRRVFAACGRGELDEVLKFFNKLQSTR